jgi:hypothetical protein
VTDTSTPTPPISPGNPPTEDEFAGIPSNPRRHPVIAVGTAALAFFLLFQIRDGVRYALSSSTVQDLGVARQVAATKIDNLPINHYVRLSGRADRESAVVLDTQGSWNFAQFFRLLGTNNRVFVRRTPDPLTAEQARQDVFVGRLMRFSDLSFQDAIRKHFADRVSATHFFVPATVHAALLASKAGALDIADLLGDRVSLPPNEDLAIEVDRPGQIRLEFPRARFADEAALRTAIEKQGGQLIEMLGTAVDPKFLAAVASFPADRRDQALHALSEGERELRIRPAHTTHQVRVADLGATPDAITIKRNGQVQTLPLAQIQTIDTLATVQIPDDAVILYEGDRPAGSWKTLVIGLFLLVFAAVNLLALRRRDL